MKAIIEDFLNGYADVYIQGFVDYDLKVCDFIELKIARRICAAVNACAGIDTETLEKGINLASQLNDAVKERNKAYNALIEANAELESLRQQNAELTELQTEIGQLAKEGVMQKNAEIERLRQQNAELLEALKVVMPYMEDLESENFEDESVGIRQDRQQTEAMAIARAALAKYDQPDQPITSEQILGFMVQASPLVPPDKIWMVPPSLARAEIRNMNEYIRLREIENFLECEGLADRFEDWYLDKQFELGTKHEPQNPADLDEF